MEKAYDRISWMFIITMLRKMGFPGEWIDCVWRLVSNCWFSVLINGRARGFFKSARGLRQGDPLSPGLFIIAAEALSRSLKELINEKNFKPYRLPRTCQKVTHLSFADDIILFCSGDSVSLEMMFDRLNNYEKASGQLISKTKSVFICSEKVHQDVVAALRTRTCFKKGSFPLTYLGCPLYVGRAKREYFNSILEKIMKRINSWSSLLLSAGGRMVLIKSVLQSIPIYTMAALVPPSSVLRDIEKILCSFMWGDKESHRSYHWFSWRKMSNPLLEGGLGYKRMSDISLSFSCKLWWNFRTKSSLWSSFLREKYCSKLHPCKVPSKKEASAPWKRLLKARDYVEPHLLWLIGKGNIDLFFDNWLSTDLSSYAKDFPVRFKDLVMNNEVHPLLCHYFLPPSIAVQAQQHTLVEDEDRAVWTVNASGMFSIKSIWNLIREHQAVDGCYQQIWNTKLPTKVSFFSWRLLHNKLPTDDVIKRKFQIALPSVCQCCKNPVEETITHLFFEGDLAKLCWSLFGKIFGVHCDALNFAEMLEIWRVKSAKNGLHKQVLAAVPVCTVWEIWRARNKMLFENQKPSFVHVCNQIKNQIMLQSHKWFYNLNWEGFLNIIQGDIEVHQTVLVKWLLPPDPYLKLNTDGCVIDQKGGGGGLCRDFSGAYIFAFSHFFGEVSVLEAETKAMEEGLQHCLRRGLKQVILETDSLVLCNILNGKQEAPWLIHYTIRNIQHLRKQGSYPVIHCYREANDAADYLAKEAVKMQCRMVLQCLDDLHPDLKEIIENSFKHKIRTL